MLVPHRRGSLCTTDSGGTAPRLPCRVRGRRGRLTSACGHIFSRISAESVCQGLEHLISVQALRLALACWVSLLLAPAAELVENARCPPHRRPFRLEQGRVRTTPMHAWREHNYQSAGPMDAEAAGGRVGRRCACETRVSDRDRGNAGIKLSVDLLRLLLLYKKRRRAMNPPSLELSHKKGHFPLWKMPSCNAVFCCMCRQRGVFCAGWGNDVRWLMSQRDAPARR